MRYPIRAIFSQPNRAIRYTIALFAACVSPVFSFDGIDATTPDEHAEIVKQALYDGLSKGNLELLEKAVQFAPALAPGSPAEARRHFCDENLEKSRSYMDREIKLAINYASDADANVHSRARTLLHLGLLMHTAQDFYSKTNYVELKIAAASSHGVSIEPYNLALVDWSKLSENEGLQAGVKELDKGSAKSAEGQKKADNVSYHDIARAAAIRETERQWNLFQALVRTRYGGRASAILIAFKSASCPDINLAKLSEELP